MLIVMSIQENAEITLFWQYPVITEKCFHEQNKHNSNYIGIPWATIIDKGIDLTSIYKSLCHSTGAFTCCQHIHFRKLIPLWKKMAIATVYTPHKIKGEDEIDGIEILPCPLYAVNVEDPTRNQLLSDQNYMECERPFLFSFAGGYSPDVYLTDVRLRIFKLKHAEMDDVYIKNTGKWHFQEVVYNAKQNSNGELNEDTFSKQKTYEYNELLLKSRYTLAPSGSGPNSIRFWEALAVGSIPVLLSDTLELPHHDLWQKSIVCVDESKLDQIHGILQKISIEEEKERRENCMLIYRHFRNNFRNATGNEKRHSTSQKINMLVQYYNDKNDERQKEIDHCLSTNLLNPDIAKIYNFCEPKTKLPVKFTGNVKLIHLENENRLSFRRAIEFANENLVGEICCISNSDIFLSHQSRWSNLTDDLHRSPQLVYALSRHEYDGILVTKDPTLDEIGYANSQDAWVFKSPLKISEDIDFYIGTVGCDNAFADRLYKSGLFPINRGSVYKIMHFDVCRQKNVANFSEFHKKHDEPDTNTKPEMKGSRLLPDMDKFKSVNDLCTYLNLTEPQKYSIVCDIFNKYVKVNNKY